MLIGVLALQGDFKEHKLMLERCGSSALEVRNLSDLEKVDGLVIPGGESTTIGKLLVKTGLDTAIKKKYASDMPIYGSCAGAIILAKDITGSEQIRLGLADLTIDRNAYGRQIDSFETDISILGEKKSFSAVFIRAPIITRVGKDLKVLSKEGKHPVLLHGKNLLITTFHPELNDDLRIHKMFLEMVRSSQQDLHQRQ